MDAVPFLRPLGLTAGIITMIQSIIWVTLSIVGILSYSCVIEPEITDPTKTQNTGEEYAYFLQTRYFNSYCYEKLPNTYKPAEVLTPDFLFIWLWVYLGFSFLWLVLSGLILKAFAWKEMPFLNAFVFMWVVVTIEITGMDLVLTVLFALDFDYITDHYHGPYKFQLLMAPITMMCIAARGFVLWIINIVIAVLLIIYTIQLPKASPRPMLEDVDDDHTSFSSKFARSSFRAHPSQWQPPIDAFTYSNRDTERVVPHQPRVPVQTEKKSYMGWTLRRDVSPKYPNKTDQNHRRQQHNDDEVNIPTPDYSPIMPRISLTPARPLRPALKSHSQFDSNYF